MGIETVWKNGKVEMESACPVPRDAIVFISKHFADVSSLVGAEVGVDRGINARSILETLPSLKKLYLIDPYTPFHACGNEEVLARHREIALQNLSMYEDITSWLFLPSEEAAIVITEQLHFVYIDGNHSKASIRADLRAWYLRVIPGGVLCGHDLTNPIVLGEVGVWASGEGILVNMSTKELQQDWWVVKP